MRKLVVNTQKAKVVVLFAMSFAFSGQFAATAVVQAILGQPLRIHHRLRLCTLDHSFLMIP